MYEFNAWRTVSAIDWPIAKLNVLNASYCARSILANSVTASFIFLGGAISPICNSTITMSRGTLVTWAC